MTSAALTRTTIATHVESAFEQGPAHKSELLASAARTQAPPSVLHRLERLPEAPVRSLRDLWAHMPEVPVE